MNTFMFVHCDCLDRILYYLMCVVLNCNSMEQSPHWKVSYHQLVKKSRPQFVSIKLILISCYFDLFQTATYHFK
jgi:hypothetical protein